VSISASPGARIFEKASTAMTSCHPIFVMSRRRRGESGWKCSVPIASFRFEIHGLDGCSPRHELPCLVSFRLSPSTSCCLDDSSNPARYISVVDVER
jgi:hypothetical protein